MALSATSSMEQLVPADEEMRKRRRENGSGSGSGSGESSGSQNSGANGSSHANTSSAAVVVPTTTRYMDGDHDYDSCGDQRAPKFARLDCVLVPSLSGYCSLPVHRRPVEGSLHDDSTQQEETPQQRFLLPNNAKLFAKRSPQVRSFMEVAWQQFSEWDDASRKIFLDGMMARCQWPQLPYTSNLIKGLLRVDFLDVVPNEIAFKILSYLDATSLCRAAQVCKSWKQLAEYNQIWLRMCKQHIGHRCQNCGWGLPTGAIDAAASLGKPYKRLYAEKHIVARNWKSGKSNSYTLCGHSDGVVCLQFSGNRVVSGSYDHTIRIWDLETRTCTHVLAGHELGVLSLQFNDCIIVSASMDKTVRIWCPKSGRCIRVLEHSEGVLSVNFDAARIVSGTVDGTVHVWDFTTTSHYSLGGHLDRINCIKLYGDRVFTASDDMSVIMWDLSKREIVRKFAGHTAQVQCLQVKGSKLVTGSLDNTLKIWDIETGRCLKTLFGHVEGVWCLAFDSLRIISGAHDRSLKIWDIDDVNIESTSSQAVQSFIVHEGSINCLGMSESMIVTGSDDRCIKIWDFGATKTQN